MEVTEDSIWNREISLLQPKHGYRFAIDSVLLAHFLNSTPEDDVLEIGAGTGVVGILLSRLKGFRSLTAIEIQEELADLCRKNYDRNRVHPAHVYEADVKALDHLLPDARFDLIFSNPPYRKTGTGRLNPNLQKRIARHEVLLTLPELFDCAMKSLKPSGRLSLVLPVFRENDLQHLVQAGSWHWQDRRYVHSFSGEPPVFMLSTFAREKVACRKTHPLIIYNAPGVYTQEVKRMLG